MKRLIPFGFLACAAASATTQPVAYQKLSVMEKASRLNTGEFVWQPEAASTGPVSLVIDLTRQRLLVYRSGIPIAASTISSGSKGRETPIGRFTVLQKELVYRSRTYDNALMPYMQRITARGVAMHAGNLPGYPASHGCIRLPKTFAKLLYGVTELGTPVIVTDAEQERRAAEYQRALEDVARQMAGLQADAEHALAEFGRAMAAHEVTMRQYNDRMREYNSKIASK